MTLGACRAEALARLLPGDIVHATAENGASLICLVEAITDQLITARTVTHQLQLEMDRSSGRGLWGEDVVCWIDSIAPLPPATFGVLLGLDRKCRLAIRGDQYRLDDDEKGALLLVDEFYRSNPLPVMET